MKKILVGIFAIAPLGIAIMAIPGQSAVPGQRTTPGATYVLTTVPAVGSVTWRCSDGKSFGLGFRPFRTASTPIRVETRANRRRTSVTNLDVGAVLAPMLSASKSQQMLVSQKDGAGELRATITVNFGGRDLIAPPCRAYLPPQFVLTVAPRR